MRVCDPFEHPHYFMARRLAIHVSGVPGCGKSYLGERLVEHIDAKGFNAVVIDTDSFITFENDAGKELLGFESKQAAQARDYVAAAHRERWQRLLQLAFDRAFAAYPDKDIVFVGVLDNFGPTLTEPPHMPTWPGASRRVLLYALTVSAQVQMQRYYKRLPPPSAAEYWDDVASGARRIPSSEDQMQSRAILDRWHTENGYTSMTYAECLTAVEDALWKSHADHSSVPMRSGHDDTPRFS